MLSDRTWANLKNQRTWSQIYFLVTCFVAVFILIKKIVLCESILCRLKYYFLYCTMGWREDIPPILLYQRGSSKCYLSKWWCRTMHSNMATVSQISYFYYNTKMQYTFYLYLVCGALIWTCVVLFQICRFALTGSAIFFDHHSSSLFSTFLMGNRKQ